MNTIVCIGAGPSLTREDVAACEAKSPLMVVNDAFQLADSPRYHYAADTRWWRRNYAYTQKGSCKFSIQHDDKDQGCSGVVQMKRGSAECFSREWPVLCTGYNSGFQAVNLVYLLGYKRVILLGYDMKFGVDGSKHFHVDHSDYNPLDTTIIKWIQAFRNVAPIMQGLEFEVMNATRDSDLDCFPRVELEALLQEKVA